MVYPLLVPLLGYFFWARISLAAICERLALQMTKWIGVEIFHTELLLLCAVQNGLGAPICTIVCDKDRQLVRVYRFFNSTVSSYFFRKHFVVLSGSFDSESSDLPVNIL